VDNPDDGRRRRLLTDLSINVASGVIIAGALKVYSVLGPVIIKPSSLWLAGAIAVVVGLPISIRRYGRRPRQVFILVSAFQQKHWVNKFLRELIIILGQHDLDMVFKAPIHDYSGHGQIQQLIRIRRGSRDYAGGFIMVTEAAGVEADLAKFARGAKYPIVFLDQRPFNGTERYPRGTAFVGCHPAEIGKRAADWVAQTLKRQRTRRPGVLVVGSNEHRDRQVSFAAALKQHVPGAAITVCEQGLFARERCKEIVERHLKELTRRGERLHVIFCTNDEMALGAVDAIQELTAAGADCDGITVVGVDGTDEALAVIRSGGSPFRATVVQDSRRVADVAVQQLLKLRTGERVEVETFLPTAVYPLETQ
jgi:ribose transport system substrate-binding protein